MLDLTDHVARAAAAIAARDDGARRLLIAIAGPPGAGKSTLSEALGAHLNARLNGAALVVPMDGFHFDNAILQERGLLARKGAPETFDADGFLALVRRLRDATGEVAIPVFDRGMDLSRASARLVAPAHRILLIEGNYLLLKRPVWQELRALFDLSLFVSPPIEVLEQRLIQRWLDHGLAPDAAAARARGNDLANAKVIIAESEGADMIIEA
ncbi:nucleoside triphosphate hydrolase [Methylovirgula sp. 4M-Z18]|uniref:nucleoside triphosphate hydrolase n=1 Tax=Methylovirgula sp. 4M-Z18 TaxID=2293567 RepID=UPI000E2E6F54|nr:nucleoside triphosphate hydrolase [Methylovirgula sp. 4M-Z18]RFB80150.1 nucleoside triphosphate hydrolase [Methylovirgula sp. 4M-Z18]